ncbi:MAG: Na+/H+ antiporter subunit E [Thermodesulfobacteriota bacterium]
MSFILTAIIMFAFWILLSGHFTFILLLSGVVSSLLVAYWSHDLLFGKVNLSWSASMVFRLIVYIPWLLWQIILANFDLVYRTLHPGMPINPRLIEFDTSLDTDAGVAILANSITLTPGTVTIKAGGDGKFLVHAIADAPAESLLEGDMQRRVEWVEKGL